MFLSCDTWQKISGEKGSGKTLSLFWSTHCERENAEKRQNGLRRRISRSSVFRTEIVHDRPGNSSTPRVLPKPGIHTHASPPGRTVVKSFSVLWNLIHVVFCVDKVTSEVSMMPTVSLSLHQHQWKIVWLCEDVSKLQQLWTTRVDSARRDTLWIPKRFPLAQPQCNNSAQWHLCSTTRVGPMLARNIRANKLFQ